MLFPRITRQECLITQLIFNITFMVLASIIAQDKEVKVIHVGKEINLSLFTNYMIFYVEIEWVKQGCTGRLEGHELIFFCKDTKIATSCWTTINRRMLEPTKKKISHVQRRSCNRGAIMLKSNPIPTRDFWKAKTKQNNLCAPGPRESKSNSH